MSLLPRWPNTGEGRAIKDATEQVSRLLDGSPAIGSLQKSIAELRFSVDALENISKNPFFVSSLQGRIIDPFDPRKMTFGRRIREISLSIKEDIDTIEASRGNNYSPVEALRSVTPAQKDGPIEFTIEAGILRIRHKTATASEHQLANIENARRALTESAKALLTALAQSNHDKRVTDLVQEAVSFVAERRDVIALGMNAIALSLIADDSANELSAPVLARLRAFSMSIGMYLAQFSEWARFTEAAAVLEYTQDDAAVVKKAGEQMLSDLHGAGPSVDPEVPRTVRWMLSTLDAPKGSLKRAVFGALRMIENFVSLIFSTAGDWFAAANNGVKKGIYAGLATVTAYALIKAATSVASAVSPTAVQVAQTSWLKDASDIAKDILPELLK